MEFPSGKFLATGFPSSSLLKNGAMGILLHQAGGIKGSSRRNDLAASLNGLPIENENGLVVLASANSLGSLGLSQITSSSRMRVINHNWSAMKQRLHPQSVADISRHSVLSGDRIRQCETSSGSRHKDTDQCL